MALTFNQIQLQYPPHPPTHTLHPYYVLHMINSAAAE